MEYQVEAKFPMVEYARRLFTFFIPVILILSLAAVTLLKVLGS